MTRKKGKSKSGASRSRTTATTAPDPDLGLPAAGATFSKTGHQKVVSFLPKGFWITIRQFVEETGKDRTSLNIKLRGVTFKTVESAGGYLLYRLRDLLELTYERDEQGRLDPERFDPYRRKAHYAAELNKMRLAEEASHLVPRIEVEQEQARIIKTLVQFLDTLPDILERDCGLRPEVLMKIEERIDKAREALYREMVGKPEGDPERSGSADEPPPPAPGAAA